MSKFIIVSFESSSVFYKFLCIPIKLSANVKIPQKSLGHPQHVFPGNRYQIQFDILYKN